MLEMEGIFEECEGINEAHGYNRETKERDYNCAGNL